MIITTLLWLICIAFSLPVLVLAAECLAGAFSSSRTTTADQAPPVSVLVPAHNEASGIARTVTDVLAQLRPGDELIVVADNCCDDTAAIAARLGARVVARQDAQRRGKGYALEFGRAHIASGPERMVVVLDADCSPGPEAIHCIAATAAKRHAIVQGAYLLSPSAEAGARVRMSCFAFLIKNLVRQIALRRLAGSALLQGSGMAFPYPIFAQVDLRPRSLVEDLELGLELILQGHPVWFEDAALFVSEASSEQATVGQRRRWEHGTLLAMGRFVPRLLRAAVRGRPRLLLVALDQLVPPAALLVAATASLALMLILLAGPAAPVMFLLAALLLLGGGLAIAWLRHGRELVPLILLGNAVFYLAWKLPIALQFLTRRERNWIRTDRGP